MAYDSLEIYSQNEEWWYGKDPSTTFLNRASLMPWHLTAGVSPGYGTEVQISNGSEIEGGDPLKKFDLRRIVVANTNAINGVIFKLQFWHGTGTFVEATFLTELCLAVRSNFDFLDLRSRRITCNNKLWARLACSTNGKTLDFLFGLHNYVA